MRSKKHVNLLYNKEIIERRSKIRSIMRYSAVIVALISIVSCIVVTIISMRRSAVLSATNTTLNQLTAQLETKRTDAVAAGTINDKAILMQKHIANELPIDEYYSNILAFLPPDVANNYLDNIDINPTGEGVFQFNFPDFDKLDSFIGYIESKKDNMSYKAYKIDQITVNEGTPSSSIVKLKVQFK